MTKLAAATDRQIELMQGQQLTAMLPHYFARTKFEVKSLELNCCHCQRRLKAGDIRGVCDKTHLNRIELELIGQCRHCSVYTPVMVRIYDDRTAGWTDADGYWNTFVIEYGLFSVERLSSTVQAVVKKIRGLLSGKG